MPDTHTQKASLLRRRDPFKNVRIIFNIIFGRFDRPRYDLYSQYKLILLLLEKVVYRINITNYYVLVL